MTESIEDVEPLVTRCPHCSTRFRVAESQLQVARGRVRCGACLTVFLGIDHLQWDLEQDRVDPDRSLDALLGEIDAFEQNTVQTGTAKSATAESDAPETDRTEDVVSNAPVKAVVSLDQAPVDQLPVEQGPDIESAAASDETALETIVVQGTGSDGEQVAPEIRGLAPPEPVVEAPLAQSPPPSPAFHQDDSDQTESEQSADLDDLLNSQVPSFRDTPPADPFAGLWVDAGPVTVPSGNGSAAPLSPAEFDTDANHTKEPVPVPSSIAWPPPLPEVSRVSDVPDVPSAPGVPPASTRTVAVPEPMDELPVAPAAADVESDPSGLEPLVVRPSAPRRRWRWVLLGVSGLLVCAQIIWYLLPSWIADPEKRWLPEKVCQFAGCTLDPLRDLSQLLLTNVVVRVDPDRPEVRQVDLLLVNSGTFAQAFPDIEITFRTPDGDRVAWKRFTPAQYLAGDMAGATAIPKKTPVRIALEVTDPGTLSYAYEITLK